MKNTAQQAPLHQETHSNGSKDAHKQACCDISEDDDDMGTDFEFQDCDEAVGNQVSTLLPKNSSDIFKKTMRAGPGHAACNSSSLV